MTHGTVTEAVTGNGGSWWSESSWFEGTAVDTSLCVSTSGHGEDPERPELPMLEDVSMTDKESGAVGGAAAQNRFNGKTAMPIGTTAAKSSMLLEPPSSRMAAIGGARTHSRFNDRKRPSGATCDGSTPGVYRPGVPLFTKWQFDFSSWEWRRAQDGQALRTGPPPPATTEGNGGDNGNHSAIAGRRWGDGRDSLGAAVAQATAAAKRGKTSVEGHGQQVATDQQQQVAGGETMSSSPAVGFAAVAGLSRAKGLLRDSVVLPLRHPRAFKAMGLPPCRGVLLHGPPGGGKTLLAYALAEEARAHLEVVNGAELVAGDKAAATLEAALDSARKNAPSVLLIEQVDVAAPCEGEARSEAARVASARILAALDALRTDKVKVCVVATTNRRSAVSPSFTRAGRLDVCVAMGALESKERLEVVRSATYAMPLAADVDLQEVSDSMQGYVPADVVGACHQAAVHAIADALDALEAQDEAADDMLPGNNDAMLSDDGALLSGSEYAMLPGHNTATLPGNATARPPANEDGALLDAGEFAVRVSVSASHFTRALASAGGPSLLREMAPEVPDCSWDDAGGLDEAKAALRDLVELPVKHADLVSAFGLPPARGALLYGPPGCGKTLLAKVVASSCGANFLSVRGPELLDKWLGESERAVRGVFEAARAASPCVVFFDELDALAPRRGAGGGGGEDAAAARVVNQILCEMDGVSPGAVVFVVGATNRPEALDPALLRPGRLDHLIKVPLPDQEGRQAALVALLRRTPLHASVDLQALAEATEGYSGADLSGLVQGAVTEAVREEIHSERQQWQQEQDLLRGRSSSGESASAAASSGGGGNSATEIAPCVLMPRHLDIALSKSRRSVGPEVVARYDEIEAALREGGGLERFAPTSAPKKSDTELQGLLHDVSERIMESKAAQLEGQLEEERKQSAAMRERLERMADALRAAGLPVPEEEGQGEE